MADVLLFDDFNAPALDTAAWKIPDGGPSAFLGRTQLRLDETPELVGGVARLRLDTFNNGSSFLGSEIQTLNTFGNAGGLAFEARSRVVTPIASGLVTSLFSFENLKARKRDEIDFEYLTNDINAGNQRALTNVFANEGFSSPGTSAFVTVPGLDLGQFNTFRIEWLPGSIRWLINGVQVREETVSVPQNPSTIRLNIWAPNETFAVAYDPSLQPAATAAENQTFFYEIDSVLIESLGLGGGDPGGGGKGGGPPPRGSAVPEPTSIIVLGATGMMVSRRGQRSGAR